MARAAQKGALDRIIFQHVVGHDQLFSEKMALQTTVKYGFGINFEQPMNDWMGLFEGQQESYAYTETDQTVLGRVSPSKFADVRLIAKACDSWGMRKYFS